MNRQEVYRQIINGCDEALRDAFIRRMEASVNIAEGKLASGGKVFDAVREEEVINGISSGLPYHLALKAQSLWKTLMRLSRSEQYSYFVENSEDLQLQHEKNIVKTLPQGPIACALSDYNIIRSIYGENVDSFFSMDDVIKAVIEERCAQMCVAADDYYNSDWLFNAIFDKELFVNKIQKNQEGGYLFNVSKHIVDDAANSIVSFALSVQSDKPGSLAQLLGVFSDHKINLEYLRYKTNTIDDDFKNRLTYVFADVTGKLSDPSMRSAILQLEQELPFFRVLGVREFSE